MAAPVFDTEDETEFIALLRSAGITMSFDDDDYAGSFTLVDLSEMEEEEMEEEDEMEERLSRDEVDIANEYSNQHILNFTTPRADEDDCPICFERMDLADIFVTQCCRHSFHVRCLRVSFAHGNWRCPVCRGNPR